VSDFGDSAMSALAARGWLEVGSRLALRERVNMLYFQAAMHVHVLIDSAVKPCNLHAHHGERSVSAMQVGAHHRPRDTWLALSAEADRMNGDSITELQARMKMESNA
jgi:hypothetical protein